MEPIATYAERRYDGKRTFKLFADSVVVTGTQTFHADFEARIPLASLDPHQTTLRVRHAACWLGIWAIIIGVVAHEVFVGQMKMSWFAPAPAAAFGAVLCGGVLCLATFRKVEFASFKTHAGVVGVDVARAGPNQAEFQAFVAALEKQIRAASSAGSGAQGPG